MERYRVRTTVNLPDNTEYDSRRDGVTNLQEILDDFNRSDPEWTSMVMVITKMRKRDDR